MKKFFSILLCLLMCLCAVGAAADEPVAAPANPNAKGADVTYVTPEPEEQGEAGETEQEDADLVVPAPDGGADSIEVIDEDAMLTEEMIAQLDQEVQDMLRHGGELIDTQKGVRNILLLGVDARPGETRSRSDTMVIATLDAEHGTIKLTSLMRDTYVSIPGKGNNRINAAYVFGGAELLMQTIEENFGLHIEDYAAIDLTLLIDVVDELGGLTLNVESNAQLKAINGVIDGYNSQFHTPRNSDKLTATGEQLMNGKQVQAYSRFRSIDNDFYRTQRQRYVLVKLYEKAMERSLVDLTLMASKYIGRLDTNLALTDIVTLISQVVRMDNVEIQQLRLPDDGDYESRMISGMSVLVPNLEACRRKLSDFIKG